MSADEELYRRSARWSTEGSTGDTVTLSVVEMTFGSIHLESDGLTDGQSGRN